MAHVREAANLIRDAGGRVVGRTRLQKLAFILEATGLGEGFTFEYRKFGPYSEELTNAMRDARLLELIDEEEKNTSWGGAVSIFSTDLGPRDDVPASRRELAHVAVQADSIELELAATALFLRLQGEANPWQETARRKPEKARADRIENAKLLYQSFRDIDAPKRLPDLN